MKDSKHGFPCGVYVELVMLEYVGEDLECGAGWRQFRLTFTTRPLGPGGANDALTLNVRDVWAHDDEGDSVQSIRPIGATP